MKVNLHPTRALWRGLEQKFLPRPSPHDVIKVSDPCALSGTTSASPDLGNESTGAPDPLGVLSPCLRDT
jgi:hypothetical protein